MVFAPAQNVFHGEIVSKKGDLGIADGYVLLIQNGKIFKTTSSDEKGNFSMNNVPSGNYIVEVTCLGYQTATPLILINGNMVNSGIGPISPSDIESIEVISMA